LPDAPRRIEFTHREDSKSRIPCSNGQGCDDLVKGRSSVATVRVLGQRRFREIEDIDVEVNGHRASGELLDKSPRRARGVRDEVSARPATEPETGSLVPLPLSGHLFVYAEPAHLERLEEGGSPRAATTASTAPGSASPCARPIQSSAPSFVLCGVFMS